MSREINLGELLSQHKNKFVNAAIFILALFITQNIYQKQIKGLELLNRKKDGEVKKNAVLKDIQQLEEKIQGYKNVVNRKDISVAMNMMSEIAQSFHINVISIKPETQHDRVLYTRHFFDLKLETNAYHNIGKFISKLESRPEIYSVEKLEIRPVTSSEAKVKKLNVGLTVSTILLKN